MSATRFLRHAATAAIAAGILGLGATDAHATHFRYGTIKWHITGTTVDTINLQVTAECAWRRTYYNPNPPNVGTQQNTGQFLQLVGNAYSIQTPLIVDVTAIDTNEDWFVGNRTFTFNGIPRTALSPLRVFWNGNARISTLMDGNADDFFNVEARVSNDPTNLFSPASSLLPIVNVAHGQPAAHFNIPATDPEGDPLTWSISTTQRSSLTKAAPDGYPDTGNPTLSINSSTGEVTWNTASEFPPVLGQELYAVQFIVRDSKGAEAPIDALLRLVPNTSQPPVALIDNSPNPAAFQVYPGSPVSFVFRGTDPDPTDVVTMNSGNLPNGSSFNPSMPFSGTQPQSTTFNWTPTLAQVGSHPISLSVTDNFNLQDTTSATITVLANFQPAVICPVDATMEATGPTTPYTAHVTVDDPEDLPMTVQWYVAGILMQTNNVPATPGPTTLDFPSAYTVDPHALRVEVRDGITNAVVCNATITVVDTTGPDIDMPGSQLLEATSPAGAVATWNPDPPHAVDLVDGPRPVICTHVSGATFPILPPPPQNTTTIVTCTSTDLHNNTTTETFDIIVQDTTPPAVTVPAPIIVEATGPNGAPVTFTPAPSANDIVDGSITPTCTHASGSTFPLGTTMVTCSAADVHGNSASRQFPVTVRDTTPPVVTVPGPLTAEATSPAGAPVTFIPAPSAFDIVDGSITPTCVPASGSTFPLFAPPPPSTTTPVTCTAMDSHGNTGSASFDVTIQDTTPPAITNVPANITVPSNLPGGGAVVTWPPLAAFDIVDGNITPTCVPASGSTFPVGTTTVNCTAADIRGNSSGAFFTVTVIAPPPVPCVTLSPGELWPPNHKMRDIDVTVVVPGPGQATCNITNVTSTEPVVGRTYGNFAPDWIFSQLSLQLRSERYDKPGRTYRVTVTCTAGGQTGTTIASLMVPHDQSPHDVDPPTVCGTPNDGTNRSHARDRD